MLHGIDYTIIYPKKETDAVQFKILSGEYADTIFQYGTVKVEEKDGTAHLQFSFDVIQSKIMKPKALMKDSSFKQYAGDFLVEYMTSNFTEDDTNEDRNSNSETLDLLGGLSS